MKQQIYNLIILDESGSMDCVYHQTITGCNETINTIKNAQESYAETQEHLISIYAFQSHGKLPSRYIIKNIPALEVKHITNDDYVPEGLTPLNDAIGATLVDLKATTQAAENAIGSVTIITDGMENDSVHFSTEKVASMIEELKGMGWNFNFIGANIDVEKVGISLHIENTLSFLQDDAGTQQMWERERNSRRRYYNRLNEVNNHMSPSASIKDRQSFYSTASKNYFDEDGERIAPDKISHLAQNEIFVFGSNLQGIHTGGASHIAATRFGAIMGNGVGLQGQSYAIPTTQGEINKIKPYVDEFITFAKAHPELRFLVTRIGCGNAGYTDKEMATLFEKALSEENIYLPKSFVEALRNK
jgi:hypothetical protein